MSGEVDIVESLREVLRRLENEGDLQITETSDRFWLDRAIAEITSLRAARDGALREAAAIAYAACLVPPDGGAPSPEEQAVSERARDGILALLSPKGEGEVPPRKSAPGENRGNRSAS